MNSYEKRDLSSQVENNIPCNHPAWDILERKEIMHKNLIWSNEQKIGETIIQQCVRCGKIEIKEYKI